jgi:hypothetical protein
MDHLFLLIGLILLVSSSIPYAVKEYYHKNGFLNLRPTGFFGRNSWKRKWKYEAGRPILAPKNWYYKFFKLKYRERFLLSSTLLVFLTDAPHLFGWLYRRLSELSLFCILFHYETDWIIIASFMGMFYILFGVGFEVWFAQIIPAIVGRRRRKRH